MAARIRTLNFLPEVFRTPTNAQFLGATLDQIVDQPNTMRIQGYIGSKFGYGVNAKDNYVVEPTQTRTDYQLDPGVVFTKTNTATATDFITYPGIIDALKLNGGVTNNNDRLFNSQFYSWDPFVDLDKLINFNQYYWLPQGAPAVTVATDIVYNAQDYTVVDDPNAYIISSNINPNGSANPTLTLIRGGTYSFTVNQDSPFWLQGQPGITGYDPNQNGFLYFLTHQFWEMFQIGITNYPDNRLKQHKKLGWEVLEIRGPMDGHLTQQSETAILRMLKAKGADLSNSKIAGKFDGYSEAWSKSTFEVKSIKELMRLTEEFEEE